MIGHFSKAVAQFSDPVFWKVLWKALAITIIIFAALVWVSWEVIDALVEIRTGWLSEGADGWLTAVVDWVAQAGVVVIVFMMFPAVGSMFVGVFLDEVADAVEKRHYPADPPGRGLDLMSGLMVGLRFALVVLVLNILVLPFYLLLLFVAGAGVFIFYGLNGYLLGREYFELVALRHMDVAAAAATRRANRGRIFVAGVIIAFLLTLPVINLLAPIAGAAFMVHVFKALPRKAT
jgi:uncharacterized protein involved in cysteine biosynthesis